LSAVGLRAKTIPFWQWPVCAQKNQRGADASFTVNDHAGKEVAFAATGINPESTPFVGVVWRTQGLVKVDCVTE